MFNATNETKFLWFLDINKLYSTGHFQTKRFCNQEIIPSVKAIGQFLLHLFFLWNKHPVWHLLKTKSKLNVSGIF
jgi:hypothetical protein